MSPEQARGEVDVLDARSDIYALGTILFELVHLRPAVSGPDARSIVTLVARGEVEWNGGSGAPRAMGRPAARSARSTIPDSLLAVCHKALALDAAARYPRVEDLQADLLAYQNGFATSAEKAGAWKQLTLFVRRNKAASIGAAAVLLVGAGFTAQVTAERNHARKLLADLRGTAPTFVAQAQALIAEEKFDDARQKLAFALDLAPRHAGTHLLLGHLLQTQLHFPDAIVSFETALRLAADPATVADARANLALCERLRAASTGGGVKKEALRELHAALLAQHRTGEAAALARHGLGRDEVFRGYQEKIVAGYGEFYRQKVEMLPDDTLSFSGYDSARTNPISDLRPLAGLPISDLNLGRHPVTDLTPLTGMPLKKLLLSNTKVRDLSPLRGMPLRYLEVLVSEVADLSPLAGMPLEHLDIGGCSKVRDLSPLKGMPMRELSMIGVSVKDVSPIRGMPLEDLDALGLITDLRILQGMPLKKLRVGNSALRDLSPLAGMALEDLDIIASLVDDLTPLRGMPLKKLMLHNVPATDLEPLRGMPLEHLDLRESAVTDLSPLLDCPTLKEIVLPAKARNVAVLRQLPRLERLSYRLDQRAHPAQTAAEFWAEYDAEQAAGKK